MNDRLRECFQERERISRFILILLLIVVLICCCALLWGILTFNEKTSIFNPLYTSTQANYFIEDNYLIPNIDPSIIREAILDRDPAATAGIDGRMATLESELLTPVSTMTLRPEEQLTATIVALTETLLASTEIPLATPSPVPSITSIPSSTPIIVYPTATRPSKDPEPAIRIIKSLASYSDNDSSNTITLGDDLWYQFKVTNIGTVTLSSITVTDVSFGLSVSCPTSTLASGSLTICAATTSHRITLAEANAALLQNTASVTGMPASGTIISDSDTLGTIVTQNAALSLSKSALPLSYDTLGQVITYTYTIVNSGNITLAGPFTVNDDKQGTLTNCATGSLAPLETTTCTDTYAVTQADLDFGSITNNATVTGNSITSPADSVTVNVFPNPSIQVIKSSTAANITAANQVVPYSFVVTNEGDITLTGVTVSDPNCATAPAYQNGDSNADSKLDLSESWTYTCSRTVTQAEMDAGGNLSNTVTADSTESSSYTDTLDIPITQNPVIEITKYLDSYDDNDGSLTPTSGDDLWFAFLVTNNGNMTLNSVSVSDDTFSIPVTCPVTTLSPGSTTTCVADTSHTVTATEAGAGKVTNTATATGYFSITLSTTATHTLETILSTNDTGISISDVSNTEKNNGNSFYQFEVSLSKSSASTITVNYTTSDGLATGGALCGADVDYENDSGVLTFTPGKISEKIKIRVCGDTDIEIDVHKTHDVAHLKRFKSHRLNGVCRTP